MIYVNAVGLGKSKFLKKIQIKKVGKALKQVSLKNAVKVVKIAAPIAVGFIPFGGGAAGKLTSKLLNSKVGKVASKLSKSKVVKSVVKVSKTKVGAFVVGQAKQAANNKIQAITTSNTDNANQEQDSSQDSSQEPVGTLTPVKQTSSNTSSSSQESSNQTGSVAENTAPKSNTIMYVGGAVALAGIAYLATKKK